MEEQGGEPGAAAEVAAPAATEPQQQLPAADDGAGGPAAGDAELPEPAAGPAAAAGTTAAAAAPATAVAKLAKRSVALHTGYVGTGYKGSSLNRMIGEAATIEQVLEAAIHKAGFISDANFGNFSKINWSRASRTDKGVHSLGTVMGLRMLVDEEAFQPPKAPSKGSSKAPKPGGGGGSGGGDVEGGAAADAINVHLPPEVRVFAVQKVNKKFNARHMCDGRVYQYYLPASMLGLACDGGPEDAARLAAFRAALAVYEGAHPYHNYTRRKVYQPQGSNIGFRGKGRKRDRANPWPADEGAAAAAAAAAAGEQAEGTAGPAAAAAGGSGGDEAAAAGDEAETGPRSEQPDAKRQRTGPAGAGAVPGGEHGAGGQDGRARRGGGGGNSDDDDGGDKDEDDEDEEPAGGELDEEDDEDGDGEGAEGAGGGGPDAPAAAAAAGGGAAAAAAKGNPRTCMQLQWLTEPNPHDRVTQTYYRRIKSFTAQDPVPLVPGGTPCLLLEVSGTSFMLHHIRHMVGTALAVALGLLPTELVQASLAAPSRVTLPRAPPHTLLLADSSFHPFPVQTGNGDLEAVTGSRLCLRQGGRERQEAFRRQVLHPSLEHLVELPEWRQWKASLLACYPYPQAALGAFLEQYRPWAEEMAAKRKAREERWGGGGGGADADAGDNAGGQHQEQRVEGGNGKAYGRGGGGRWRGGGPGGRHGRGGGGRGRDWGGRGRGGGGRQGSSHAPHVR